MDAAFLRLVLVAQPHLVSLPLWFIMNWLHLQALNPFMETLDVREANWKAISSGRTHVQADGEWLGALPARVRLLPDALWLLRPGRLPAPAKRG